MGTRADFYIRENEKMEWIGSIAWDGYPSRIDDVILKSKTKGEYIENVHSYLSGRKDWTSPEHGWPWPWEDSCTTDFSYIFENDKVMASCFGYPLFDPCVEQIDDEEKEE